MAKKYISKYTGAEIDSGLDNIPKLEGKLTELKSLESEVGFSKVVTLTSAEIDFHFIKGETYSITNNNDSSKTVSIVSKKGASDRNNVTNLNAGQTLSFVAEIDAECFRCAQNGTFTIVKLALLSEVAALKEDFATLEPKIESSVKRTDALSDNLFNYDTIGEVVYEKTITTKVSGTTVALDYLGKAECTFIIDGTPNNCILVGTNKATGNQMHLYDMTTETAFPLTITNPRADLELINIGILGKSTATPTPITLTIKKNVKSSVSGDTDANVDFNKEIFNYDKSRDVTFEKNVQVLPSTTSYIIDYVGKGDCEIIIDGNPNNFILQVWVNELNKTVELGRYTTEDAMPIVISNPRYYQELGELKIYGTSTAIKDELKVSIKRKNGILKRVTNIPLVKFDFDHTLKDVSGTIAQFSPNEWDSTNKWRTMPNQLYNAFNGLVSQYPSYVSRVDIAEELGIEYPTYANLGGVANSQYAATPTYKTYMYKLSCGEDTANGAEQTTKLKLLIVAGVHGNESFASINTYNLAKSLCEAVDVNYYKMRGAFDVYIIPCLNTYGMYHFNSNMIHDARCNANDVNINRNFPIKEWKVEGEGTQNYTGAVAGSEFETQLVMGALNLIQPNLFIDHHNFGAESMNQYFCTVNEREYIRLNYQSYMDCSIAFSKGLPQYFGNAYLQLRTYSMGSPSSAASGTTNRWCYENGLADFSATTEICNVIKYKNGILLDENVGEDYYGADALSIGEYTLRNILMRFCQYVMEMLTSKNGYPMK